MASKRRLRRKKCENKVRHTLESAFIAKAKLTSTGRPVNIYKCSFCGGYHLGHGGKRGAKAMEIKNRS